VRAFVDDVLLHPARLKAGLERYVRDEHEAVLRGDAAREAKAWAKRIAAADRQRARYQQMAAEELITFSELKERLAELRDTKRAAQSEFDALTSNKEQMAELERSVDDLLSTYASITPEIHEATVPEERHQLYKMLGVKVSVWSDGKVESELVRLLSAKTESLST
jgi:seryl-tRNA synthetase